MVVWEQISERRKADAIGLARVLTIRTTPVNPSRFMYSTLQTDYGAAVAIIPQSSKDSMILIDETEDEGIDAVSHPSNRVSHC